MTRTAALIGVLLGLVSIGGGVQGYLGAGSSASLVAGVGAGLVLLVGGWGTLRHRGSYQVVMAVVAFALLARFLPVYFQTYRVWPALVMIALATFTFGFALLGFVLDRYSPKSAKP